MSKKEQREVAREALRRWHLGRRLGSAILDGIPPRPATPAGAAALRQVIAEVELEHQADRGRKFTGRKRGSKSRLYREAVALLPGSAKVVLRKLENSGIVEFDEAVVKWKDDHGVPRTTSRKKFEDQLSRYRARQRE
jgi:hypothetical protein